MPTGAEEIKPHLNASTKHAPEKIFLLFHCLLDALTKIQVVNQTSMQWIEDQSTKRLELSFPGEGSEGGRHADELPNSDGEHLGQTRPPTFEAAKGEG